MALITSQTLSLSAFLSSLSLPCAPLLFSLPPSHSSSSPPSSQSLSLLCPRASLHSSGAGNNHSNGNNVQGVIEETLRSCLSPLFKELLSNSMGVPWAAATRGFGGLGLNPIPLNFSVPAMNLGIGEVGDERWRKQQILELEVYSKRLELVQDQIKAAMDELRSRGG